MSKALEYKGYVSAVEFSAEDRCFNGKVTGIRDLVAFDGTTVDELEKNFHEAVDEYLAFCKAENKEPAAPFRGVFQVRLKGDLHRNLAMYAQEHDESINEAVNKAVEKLLVHA